MGKTDKHKKKSKKHKHKKSKRKHKNIKDSKKPHTGHSTEKVADESGFEIPVELMNTKSHTPITPQEHQHRQTQMRRVVDPDTGRVRLIRGENEIMEEIVSKEQHKKINAVATQADGLTFQKHTIGKLKQTK